VRGDTLGSDGHTLLRLSATHAAKTGSDVARIAYSISGTAGIFTDHPLAQALQDSLVVTQHVFLAEGTWQSAGRMLLGFPAGPAFP
jgi:alkylation response protein AidB-like acyl-CoA dehydrogenase